MKAFHCYSPEERQSKCVTLFASLTTYEVFYKMPSDDEQDSDSDEVFVKAFIYLFVCHFFSVCP